MNDSFAYAKRNENKWDMIKECEKHLAKIEYNDRFSASNIDEAISNCMDELKDIVCTYGK